MTLPTALRKPLADEPGLRHELEAHHSVGGFDLKADPAGPLCFRGGLHLIALTTC